MRNNKAPTGYIKGSSPEISLGVSHDLISPSLRDDQQQGSDMPPAGYAAKPLPFYPWQADIEPVLKARYQMLGLSHNTWAPDWALLRRTCGAKHPAQIGLAEMEATILTAGRAGSRATYVARYKSLWKTLRQLGIVPDSPRPDEQLPKIRKPRGVPRPMTLAEAEVVMREAKWPVNEWAILAATNGLRAGECAMIQGSWLEETYDGYSLTVAGKGNTSLTIAASPQTVAVVQSHKTLGRLYQVSPSHLSDRANAEIRRLIGGNKTFHSLRHFHATWIYQQTGDLLLVSEMLRHASLNTTRGYAQLKQGRQQQVLNQLFSTEGGESRHVADVTA